MKNKTPKNIENNIFQIIKPLLNQKINSFRNVPKKMKKDNSNIIIKEYVEKL